MTKPFLMALAVAALTGCGGGSDDSTGPSLDPADVRGTWELTIGDAPNCWRAFALRFTVPESADGSGGVVNFVSTWGFPTSTASAGPVSGNFDMGRRSFAMVFTRAGSQRARFEGPNPTTTTASGTFTDLTGGWRTMLGGSGPGCTALATATKL